MTPTEINKLLVNKAEAALSYLFKGAGKLRGGRFSVGNINGEDGESLYVYLSTGRFKDAATGDRGDLLELFSLKYGSKQSGIDAAHSFLGINKPMSKKFTDKVIPWKKPKKDWTQLTENPAVLKYLTEVRKIPIDVLKKYDVSARDNKEYAFITYTHDTPPVACGANYTALKRTLNKSGELKKVVLQSINPLATLFGHQAISDKRDQLIITEGQIDCMSFAAQGLKNTVSVPFGTSAMQWIENSWDFISQFTEVCLCFDNDAAGNEAVETIAKKIGFEKCKRIMLPANYTDANEAHLDDFNLTKAVESAVEFKPDKLVDAADLATAAIKILSQGKREDQGTPFMGWEDEEETINFRIRPREMTIWTGFPGGGKSNALYQNTAYLAFVKGEASVIASLEEETDVITGLIMIHALGMQYSKEKNVHDAFVAVGEAMRKKIFFYSFRGRAPFEEVLKTAEFVIRKHGAKHFIFDSVAKTDLNIEDNQDANKFVSTCVTSMNDTGAHYHLVAHSRKGNDNDIAEMPGLQQIKGASAFGVETFNSVTVWKNKMKKVMVEQATKYKDKGGFKSRYAKPGEEPKSITVEDAKRIPDGYINVDKQKVGGNTGRYPIWFDRNNYRVSRVYAAETKPYAKEIYEHFIINGGDQEEAAF
jgi:twinkle protein